MTPEELDGLRRIGDPAADAVITQLVADHPGEPMIALVTRSIRDPLAAPRAIREWRESDPGAPAWADPVLVERGQAVFRQWSLQIATVLACTSLPWAYAGADGAKVLVRVSALRGPGANRRLAETMQMVLNVCDLDDAESTSFRPGSRSLTTIRSVRLLHGAIRRHVGTMDGWDSTSWGVPVNQEDLLGTLMSFTTVVFEGLHRLGVKLAADDRHAYLHLWSVIGWHLGIDHPGFPLTLADARDVHRSIMDHQHQPCDESREMTVALVEELKRQVPRRWNRLPETLMHRTLGRSLATTAGVPPPAWWIHALVPLSWFGRMVTPLPGVRRVNRWPAKHLGSALLHGYIHREAGGTPRFIVGQSVPSGVEPSGVEPSAVRSVDPTGDETNGRR